jgi:glyoxylate reductase
MGRIGKEVARRARAFSMRILYCNRRRDPEAEQEFAAEYRPLPELLAESDFVTLNCPLTAETTGLISAPELARMKPTGILINMARGPVVDGDALCQALQAGQIACAALDVTDPEPLPRNHPLLGLRNLVITPHLGSASDRTRRKMMSMTVENLRAGLEGKPLPWQVRAPRPC